MGGGTTPPPIHYVAQSDLRDSEVFTGASFRRNQSGSLPLWSLRIPAPVLKTSLLVFSSFFLSLSLIHVLHDQHEVTLSEFSTKTKKTKTSKCRPEGMDWGL